MKNSRITVRLTEIMNAKMQKMLAQKKYKTKSQLIRAAVEKIIE